MFCQYTALIQDEVQSSDRDFPRGEMAVVNSREREETHEEEEQEWKWEMNKGGSIKGDHWMVQRDTSGHHTVKPLLQSFLSLTCMFVSKVMQ